MKLIIRLLLAATAVATFVYLDTPPAKASWVVSCQGEHGMNFLCSLFDANANPKFIEGPAAGGMTDDQRANDAAWVKFCQPKFVRDKYNVARAVYAHDGCEFGRTE